MVSPMQPSMPPCTARTVADLVDTAARARPDRVAVVGDTERVTWAELAARSRTLAAGLSGLGLVAGDRLVLQVGNRPEFVAVYLAAARAGLVVVPVNPGYTLSELEGIVTDCDPRVLVTSTVATIAASEQLRAEHPGLAGLVVAAPRAAAGSIALDDLWGDPRGEADEPVEPPRSGEDIAVLLYTSGTSGRAKGAMLSHRALLANVQQVAAITPPLADGDDVLGLFAPLFHVFGLGAGLGLALFHGVTVVLAERFDPVQTLRRVAEQGVTVLVGAPGVFAACAAMPELAAHLRGVRLALTGAAPRPPELVAAYAEAGVALHEGYGLTETAPVVSTDAVDAAGRSRVGRPVPGSVGAAIPGVTVSVVDASGAPVEDGDPGVLRVRGANLFSGYWPAGADGPDADGWFTTGDVGYRDPSGDLYLVGRDVELVLVNGFNVYPAEVEQVIAAVDGVGEVAVVGEPDERTGQRVVAYVVADPTTPGRHLEPSDVLAAAARSLARFKVPARVEVVEQLPHSGIGKVQKWRLGPEPA